MKWFIEVLRKRYATFNGRAHREEFWMFTLINLAIYIVVGVIGALLHTRVVSYLYFATMLIPNLAVGVRRLHDSDRSGWWLLLYLVPLVGPVVLIFFWIEVGWPGENRYGPSQITPAIQNVMSSST